MSADSEEAFDDFADPISTVVCWRCELEVPAEQSVCPHCEAQLRSEETAASQGGYSKPRTDPFKVLMWSYALLLASTILLALSLGLTIDDDAVFDDQLRTQALTQMFVAEVIDVVIVCVAMAMCYRVIRPPSKGTENWLLAWLVFVPMLAVLLLINYQYHWLLREFLHIPLIEDELTVNFGWLVFLVYCIQPAIVEEAYCRGLALGVLRNVLGRHWAVWISAIMFGLFHVGSPLSIPYLTLLGVYLGYARLMSGNLLLPVLLHFVHNLVVLLWK